jgi:predicted DNA-binding protein
MEILEANITKRSRPVLVRLTPETYSWLNGLSERAGGGIATTIRSILEAARQDGVSVVGSAEATEEPPRRRRRKAEVAA